MTGRRFSRLVVLGPVERRRTSATGYSIVYLCRCDCGADAKVDGGNLRTGHTTSCGCHKREVGKQNFLQHGLTETAEWRVWASMVRRCTMPSQKTWAHYGGRGIECRFSSVEEFVDCVGPRPSPKHQIDRIDNDGHYEPGNVRWVTRVANMRNRSNSLRLCYMGVDRPLIDWSEIFNVKYRTLRYRYQKGWTPEEVLFGRQ